MQGGEPTTSKPMNPDRLRTQQGTQATVRTASGVMQTYARDPEALGHQPLVVDESGAKADALAQLTLTESRRDEARRAPDQERERVAALAAERDELDRRERQLHERCAFRLVEEERVDEEFQERSRESQVAKERAARKERGRLRAQDQQDPVILQSPARTQESAKRNAAEAAKRAGATMELEEPAERKRRRVKEEPFDEEELRRLRAESAACVAQHEREREVARLHKHREKTAREDPEDRRARRELEARAEAKRASVARRNGRAESLLPCRWPLPDRRPWGRRPTTQQGASEEATWAAGKGFREAPTDLSGGLLKQLGLSQKG